jgi:hypothetical protein
MHVVRSLCGNSTIFHICYLIWFLGVATNSTRKINDNKIYALKVERVPNTFENLNSFEMTLIYQKYIFWGFHCFFAIFGFFL